MVSSGPSVFRHDHWHDDNHQQNDDSDDYAQAHLHVLPPHLLPDPVGTTTETLGGLRQVIGLVLETVKSRSAIGDLVDVLAHNSDSIIDLLLDSCSSLVAGRALGVARAGAGDVRIIGLVGHRLGV
jgi:hypothetical protein